MNCSWPKTGFGSFGAGKDTSDGDNDIFDIFL